MNYNHLYHAGNFADVFKHCVLGLVIQKLIQKDKPFCYVDTHAGSGIYNLQSTLAQKTCEYQEGVGRILACNPQNVPQEIAFYLDILKKLNPLPKATTLNSDNIKIYPGSPILVRSMLRPIDRMILMELQTDIVSTLKKLFSKDKQVAIHHGDGYQGLKAHLPHQIRRGLVLIDPPFEQKNEWQMILEALEVALTRWSTGIYAIWYPIKDFTLVDNFLRAINKMQLNHLVCQMTIKKPLLTKIFMGCGMVIINPPWQIETTLHKVLPWLWQMLSHEMAGSIKIKHHK